MAAFERVKSGISGIDEAFDNIRLGDNVVWQLSTLDEFRVFVDPYVTQAVADGRNLIYMRFASHDPLVEPQPGLKIYHFDPHEGFEAFTVSVREVITKEGFDAFYVFDCLSDLQVAWSADLMMGNFFRVTCPYLFILDTVAFFPILRGRHSFEAIATIRDTTQLLIDVCTDDDSSLFVHPLKVWQRYSPTMFMPHRLDVEDGTVETLLSGVDTARFYNRLEEQSLDTAERNIDSWDRFFMRAQMEHEAGVLDEEATDKMCDMMMTHDGRMGDMIRSYFKPDDYFSVRNRMIGTGLIGGKACGMLLARRIVEERLPDIHSRTEPHDSFYIGTDVFYTYIVANDLWGLRIEQRHPEGFVKAAPALQKGLREGEFPRTIKDSFERILDYYGQCPIIVRSSSFLEDGFGNAFAGKYDSVFCANVGTFEDRLAEFEAAVKHVYASTLDPSALEYRLRNGLDKVEEQMALLVQRVSGSHYTQPTRSNAPGSSRPASYYMPTAAGVGYSHSAYCWMEGMDPDAGMLRLVMGLGTKAVDRTGQDYPRILSLDRPLATTAKTVAEKHRFSQRTANYIDVETRSFAEASVLDMADALPAKVQQAVFEHDFEAESRLRERGDRRSVLFASCEGLARNREFTGMMRQILSTLQDAYSYPVDIEYAINVSEDGNFVVNLLQCRPLQGPGGSRTVDVPSLPDERLLLSTRGTSMGGSFVKPVDFLIVIDPERYYRCPYVKKPLVANLIGRINARIGRPSVPGTADSIPSTEDAAAGNSVDPLDASKCLLFSPGRIGTSSPELGVPVSFADICNLSGIFEVGYSGAGYAPELSFGSHMFQDLVEADIFYGAVFENAKTIRFSLEALDDAPNLMWELDDPDLEGIVRILDVRDRGITLYHDMISNATVLGF